MTRQQITGWILVAASVLAIGMSAWTSYRARAYATCQAEAVEHDRALLRQLVVDVAEAGTDEDARQKALRDYLSAVPHARCA